MASSHPATSAKVVFGVSLLANLAFDLPKPRTLLPPPWALLRIIKNTTPTIRKGTTLSRNVPQKFCWAGSPFQVSNVPAATRAFNRSTNCGLWELTQVDLYFAAGVSLVVTKMV